MQENNKEKLARQSNIEMLRIFSMLGVIVLHYNNPSIGGGIVYADGINRLVLYALESLFICAVDLFILINGYFSCNNNKRTILKPLELLVQVVVFKELLYLLKVILGKDVFSATKLCGNLIPSNWFVVLYVTLYFISPLLNIVIEKAIEKKLLRRAIIIMLIAFSVYPTCVDILQEILSRDMTGLSSIGMYGSQWGYTIVNFSMMYMLGAYIRNAQFKKKNVFSYLGKIILLVFILVIWALANDSIGYGTERSAWEYCNPLVIMIAVELFKLFINIDLGSIKPVNELAKGAFTVFLLHISFLPFIKIEHFVTSNVFIMVLHIIISVVAIYIICFCIYEIYEAVTRPIYNLLSKKLPVLTKDIYYELEGH